MAGKDRINPVATLPRTSDRESAEMDDKVMTPEMAMEQDPHRRTARPDPETGEVPAGPGDAGLEDRPEANAGSPGTEQMSNSRLSIGLCIAALLAILVFVFAAMV